MQLAAYCAITIDDELPRLKMVTFQNGSPIGKLYLTTTVTSPPGCVQGVPHAVHLVGADLLAFSQVEVAVRLLAVNPGYLRCGQA